MPGERTPDTSPPSKGGSSDDDISLREHMQRQLDTVLRYVDSQHDSQGLYFERIIADMRDLLDQRFQAQQNAVDELKTTTTQRFEGVNEFRAQLADQARTFMGRDESISRHERNSETMTAMGVRHDNEIRLMRERFESELKGLRDRHETDMAGVNSRLDLGQGRSTGIDKAWGYVIGLVGLAGGIVGLVIATR